MLKLITTWLETSVGELLQKCSMVKLLQATTGSQKEANFLKLDYCKD